MPKRIQQKKGSMEARKMKRRWIAALSCALGLGLVACGGSAPVASPAPASPTIAPTTAAPATTDTVAPQPTNTSAPTVQAPVGQPVDAKVIIATAMDALDKNGPYRMKVTTSLDANPAEIDVMPPDRSYYKSTLDGKPVEIISIGATSYVLDPDGTWQTLASQDAGVDKPLLSDPEALKSLQDITALGNKTVNGASATGYTFVDSTSPKVTNTLWIDAQGKPIQMITVEDGAQTTYDISYDASIKIEAPAK
jgi:hypothetical protein